MNRMKKLKQFFDIKRAFVFQYSISFIDPPLGVFGEIFPSVMIFHNYHNYFINIISDDISSLQEIFRRIPRAEGL